MDFHPVWREMSMQQHGGEHGSIRPKAATAGGLGYTSLCRTHSVCTPAAVRLAAPSAADSLAGLVAQQAGPEH